MKDLKDNIKLFYLYRDAGNYKQYGNEVFTNIKNLSLSKIYDLIKENLIDGEFFEAKKCNLKELYSYKFDEKLDHGWHEFEKIEFTKEKSHSNIDIEQFISLLRRNQ